MTILMDVFETREVQRTRGVQKERFYAVVCPACGQVRYLRLSDAKRRHDKPCKCCAIAAAREAYVEKYGEGVGKNFKEYRMRKPSSLEVKVMKTLDGLGIDYAREYKFETNGRVFYLDLVILKDHEVVGAIECNGAYWHSFDDRIERDKIVGQAFPKPLLWVGEKDSDWLEKLEVFIEAVLNG